jgi:pimeloyl-ACP methyl ester carboxylesterase
MAAARAALANEWTERAALARRWGIRITADKAVARWMGAGEQRGSEGWRAVKGVVQSGGVDEFCGLVDVVVECLEGDVVGELERLEVRALILAGSGDGVMPEDMAQYPQPVKRARGVFKVVENAGRVFWWDENKAGPTAEVLVKWIDGKE